MALSSAAKENIALKKLVGKAHTHNSVEAFAEPKTTGLTQSTSTIFSDIRSRYISFKRPNRALQLPQYS